MLVRITRYASSRSTAAVAGPPSHLHVAPALSALYHFNACPAPSAGPSSFLARPYARSIHSNSIRSRGKQSADPNCLLTHHGPNAPRRLPELRSNLFLPGISARRQRSFHATARRQALPLIPATVVFFKVRLRLSRQALTISPPRSSPSSPESLAYSSPSSPSVRSRLSGSPEASVYSAIASPRSAQMRKSSG